VAEPSGSPRKKDAPERDSNPDSSDKKAGNNADLWRFFGSGMQLAATVGLFALLGWWLDGKFGWTPWGLVACGSFGTLAGLYHFLKGAMK
jgi:F0F1-type ATP synthase assembly protein I